MIENEEQPKTTNPMYAQVKNSQIKMRKEVNCILNTVHSVLSVKCIQCTLLVSVLSFALNKDTECGNKNH